MPLPYRRRHQTMLSTRFRGEDLPPVDIAVNNRGATRLAVIGAVTGSGIPFITRSDWHATEIPETAVADWDYHSVVLHHAGNSHSCGMPGLNQLKDIEGEHMAISKISMPYHFAIDCSGRVFEGMDLRYVGEHLKNSNTGHLGIVLLADLSKPGEAVAHRPERLTREDILDIAIDAIDLRWDTPTQRQIDATRVLVRALASVFPLKRLGGHSEFAAKLGDNRSCPGSLGLEVSKRLRAELSLGAP